MKDRIKKLRTPLIILGIIFCFTIPAVVEQKLNIDRVREGCERVNSVRLVLHDTLVHAKSSQQELLDNISTQSKYRTLVQESISIYDIYIDNLEQSAFEYAIGKNETIVDCEDAYPYPWNALFP